jgi:hypothetical protein
MFSEGRGETHEEDCDQHRCAIFTTRHVDTARPKARGGATCTHPRDAATLPGTPSLTLNMACSRHQFHRGAAASPGRVRGWRLELRLSSLFTPRFLWECLNYPHPALIRLSDNLLPVACTARALSSFSACHIKPESRAASAWLSGIACAGVLVSFLRVLLALRACTVTYLPARHG